MKSLKELRIPGNQINRPLNFYVSCHLLNGSRKSDTERKQGKMSAKSETKKSETSDQFQRWIAIMGINIINKELIL
ncbi:hypothetical protein GS511_08510 [Leptospira borgpetersenii]|uniref:Uncharacterized protein n=1 Tax=Leptospira borgpetersenii serovar Ballum TaxID=280505 RepID=A0A0E3BL38_LEPBO|nr:hypothetical protein LBBP_02099 [Leptospira borgpetersenii serovar Ballum]ANH01015.1 Uncharacterized protein LB4E_1677 [Leptospira borgpetersenii str. 4E]QHE27023.1 hypothetical protein GS524_08505 [Leptospira borgpetersenii]KGE22568.1 hypothetical protein IQ66_16030 [Leptospira borgpetersenii serovar Ballum]OOV44796.1 hypothetical protein B1H38_06940 [Leptospira borgpetersenii serovar Ballum]